VRVISVMTIAVGIMTIPVMPYSRGVSDIGTRRVSNYASDDRAHRTSGQQSSTGAHGAITKALLRDRAHRGESDTGGNCRNGQ
jgi:hypothetical protein